jgi:sugar/nucleoside kinase (ribokinase family)
MNIDVVCVGSPFLDLIFRGLPSLPVPGEEQLAERLVIVPGGMANVAYALRCLGLEAVVCAPVGRDPAGRLLGELMADAGIPWLGHDTDATPVSVALPADGERAFVTVIPAAAVDLDALARITARAIVVDLPSVAQLPRHSHLYAVVGDPEVNVMVGRLPSSLGSVRALILNERELGRLTGRPQVAAAAASLAALGTTVVVTRGAGGVAAIEPGGQLMTVTAPAADVPDTTGAGDLFAAAYVWADLAGRPLEDRLDLATRYATRSLERATDRQKGIPLRDFMDLVAQA